MKKSVLMIVLSFVSVFLISNSCTGQVAICDVEGNLLVQKSKLLEAFNSISSESASDVTFSYQESSDIHSLLFLINGAKGVAFELSREGDNYIINKSANSVSHSCSGAPCNSCDLKGGGMFTAVSCKCLQTNCSGCKCNHTVTSSTGGANLTGDDLEKALIRRR